MMYGWGVNVLVLTPPENKNLHQPLNYVPIRMINDAGPVMKEGRARREAITLQADKRVSPHCEHCELKAFDSK